MKDEIKEIKDNLKINEYLDLIQEDKNLSMGYVSLAQYIYILECRITNLQEENEKLKEELQQEKKDFKEANDYCFELKDYKLRNENAIEYLEKYDVFKEFTFPLMKRDEENQVKSSIDYQFKKDLKKNLLNILQGVGKDE